MKQADPRQAERLKPCPFCGGEMVKQPYQLQSGNYDVYGHATPNDSVCPIAHIRYSDGGDFTQLWNNRAEEAQE